MKKINLSIAQDIKEIKFIQKKIKKKITWLPLNLETLLYLDLNKYDYINLSKYFRYIFTTSFSLNVIKLFESNISLLLLLFINILSLVL